MVAFVGGVLGARLLDSVTGEGEWKGGARVGGSWVYGASDTDSPVSPPSRYSSYNANTDTEPTSSPSNTSSVTSAKSSSPPGDSSLFIPAASRFEPSSVDTVVSCFLSAASAVPLAATLPDALSANFVSLYSLLRTHPSTPTPWNSAAFPWIVFAWRGCPSRSPDAENGEKPSTLPSPPAPSQTRRCT